MSILAGLAAAAILLLVNMCAIEVAARAMQWSPLVREPVCFEAHRLLRQFEDFENRDDNEWYIRRAVRNVLGNAAAIAFDEIEATRA